ncbi:MAG: phage major capsid protein [Planctomycetaceae bacterium]|nr:phage major capsid protein [Planctomycetaceae bacterium]
MDEETKKLIEAQAKAIADFRAANDKALAQKAEKGYVDAQLQERVEKLNAKIDEIGDSIKAATERLEKRIQTAGLFGPAAEGAEKELLVVEQFGATVGRVVSLEEYRSYRKEQVAYLRRGLVGDTMAALSEGSDPDGGYLVTPDTSGRMVKKLFESSPIRQIAAVQTITSEALEGTTDLNDVGAVTWVGETTTPTETDTPQVGKWRIPVHEMAVEPRASQRLLDDAAVDVEAWLSGKVADKMARGEATVFVTGNGVAKPRGFTTYTTAATADASRSWGTLQHVESGTSGAVTADELIDLVHELKPHFRAGARWVMSRRTLAKVRKLKDGQGNYLWERDFKATGSGLLLGFPITEAEDMPAVAANALAIAFGDFMAGYQIVDRQGIRVLRDPFTAKPQVKFYTTRRVGGDVIDFEAIKFLKIKA